MPSARGAACLWCILRAGRMGPCSSAGVGRSSAGLSPECRHAGWARQGWMSPGRGRTPAGQRPLNVVLPGDGASAAAHSLEEGRARAGTGCHGGTLALRSLRAGATEPEPRLQLPAPCPSCRTAQHRAAGRAGQGRAGCGSAGLVLCIDGLLLSFPLQQEGAAAGGGGGCPGPLLCGGARPLPRRQGRRAPAAAGRSLGSPWQPSAGRTARCRGPSR